MNEIPESESHEFDEAETPQEPDWDDNFHSGVVAVVGKPNVGKSTLINAILGEKIAITTPKPQTTRRNQLGIYTEERGQILFTDTAGLHKPQTKLGEYMMSTAEDTLKDADIILWLLDGSEPPQKADDYIAETIQKLKGDTPVFIVINKIDQAKTEVDEALYQSLIDSAATFKVSALKSVGIAELVTELFNTLPAGPPYYPEDQLSDVSMRFITAETIREKAMMHLAEEVPHALAVEIVDYKEKENRTDIFATIHVEKDSQKGIVIGKRGAMIKQIGIESRAELEAMLDMQVYLDLHVKVLKNWRTNENFMKRVGYHIPKDN